MSEAKWQFSYAPPLVEYHVGIDLSNGCLFVDREGKRVVACTPDQSMDLGRLLIRFAQGKDCE